MQERAGVLFKQVRRRHSRRPGRSWAGARALGHRAGYVSMQIIIQLALCRPLELLPLHHGWHAGLMGLVEFIAKFAAKLPQLLVPILRHCTEVGRHCLGYLR